jgi:hypothetical protein
MIIGMQKVRFVWSIEYANRVNKCFNNKIRNGDIIERFKRWTLKNNKPRFVI